jgi:hypothetical protein
MNTRMTAVRQFCLSQVLDPLPRPLRKFRRLLSAEPPDPPSIDAINYLLGFDNRLQNHYKYVLSARM